jgi:uncharacterized protein DUF4386
MNGRTICCTLAWDASTKPEVSTCPETDVDEVSPLHSFSYDFYKRGHMRSSKNPGRIAGFLYFLLVIAAPFRLIYIPTILLVRGNATATVHNIAAHETLFRLGIVTDLFSGTILIFLVLALYRLFKGVDQYHAVLMVILGGVLPSAIDFFNVLNDAAALMLVRRNR